MTQLLIVESPAKARTIQKYLGKGFTVKASVGHVIDLPKTKLGVDVDNGFAPDYTVIRGKKKVLTELLSAAKKADGVLLATDLDREGEMIAWHIANHLATAKKPLQRIVFNEITKAAIKRAIENPGDIDLQKVQAQQARRILDRLVGYQVSPQLWSLFFKGLSAGRVQTVALRLVCEREIEIEAFKSEEYWTIQAIFRPQGEGHAPGEILAADLFEIDGVKLKKEGLTTLTAAADAHAVAARVRAGAFQVEEIVRKERKRSPKPPLITSTLQQEAARRCGFSARKTMTLAQQLYEGVEFGAEGPVGLITYMRTDSVRLSQDAQRQAAETVEKLYGPEMVVPGGRGYRSAKKAQDAHEAVRPTSFAITPEKVKAVLEKDLYRLYDLIWRRAIASQMPDARFDQTTVVVAGDGLRFRATGSRTTEPGFLRAMPDADDDESSVLPVLAEGESMELADVDPKQHFTQPPPRYRDASLVRELESHGIGRPSTYAAIISTLIDRKYVEREKGAFVPTRLGREVWDLLGRALPHLFAVEFTAHMEDDLDRVESGELQWQDVIGEFYGPFRQELEKMEADRDALRKSLMAETDIDCPRCGSKLVEKWGSNGKFLSCPTYPECKYSQPLPGDLEELDENCPDCGKVLQVRRGRFGRFVACSGYPDCKFTRPITIGVACPREGCDGQLTERRSKRGRTFYGCDRYPDCDFTSWNRPVARACEACGNPYVVEKYTQSRGRQLVCPVCKAEALE